MATSTTENLSNAVAPTSLLEQYLSLFEGDGIAEWWISNVMDPNAGQDQKDYFTRNFPRSNPVRRAILRLAMSMPTVRICAADTEEAENLGERGKERREEIQAAIDELVERPTWEGEKTLQAALEYWRKLVLVVGDVPVKLPVVRNSDKTLVVQPERMQAQRMKVLPHPTRRKVVEGYQFQYLAGGQFSDAGSGEQMIIEEIYRSKWIVKNPDGTEKVFNYETGFIPVACLRWEERDEFPRGLPLIKGLLDVLRHLLSVPVRKNAGGPAPTFRPGVTLDISDAQLGQTCDFKLEGGNLDLSALEQEYKDARMELNEEAFVPNEAQDQGTAVQGRSGKAIEQMSQSMIAYRESYTTVEGSFLRELIFKTLYLEGKIADLKPTDIRIEYGPVQKPTLDDQIKLGNFFVDAGFMREALLAVGVEEDQVDSMIEEKNARALDATRRMTGLMAGKPEPEDDLSEDETGDAGAGES
jgi:hypothetical protein